MCVSSADQQGFAPIGNLGVTAWQTEWLCGEAENSSSGLTLLSRHDNLQPTLERVW